MKIAVIISLFLAVLSGACLADDTTISSEVQPQQLIIISSESFPVSVFSSESSSTDEVQILPPVTAAAVSTQEQKLSTETAASPEVLPIAAAPVVEKKTARSVASIQTIVEYFGENEKLARAFMKKVLAGKPEIGMNSEMLSLIYGDPLRKIQRKVKDDIVEIWVIENCKPNEKERSYTVIGLKNDKVLSIDNYSKDADVEKMIKEMTK